MIFPHSSKNMTEFGKWHCDTTYNNSILVINLQKRQPWRIWTAKEKLFVKEYVKNHGISWEECSAALNKSFGTTRTGMSKMLPWSVMHVW